VDVYIAHYSTWEAICKLQCLVITQESTM